MADQANPDQDAGVLRVRLFGGLQTSRGGVPRPRPAATAALCLRVVATHGALHVDELGDLLWPDTPAPDARSRLRNVLSRLRSTCGEVLVRAGESVALAETVTVDLHLFEADARRALDVRRGAGCRESLAERALSYWAPGELLPEDAYRDWAVVPRERARRERLALLDLLASSAAAAGDMTGALQRWQEAIDLEPYDEGRYADAARALAAVGRWGAAERLLRQAAARLAELGLTTSPHLEDVRRDISA